MGDWRPPSLYIYDNSGETLTDISLNGLTGYPFVPRFVSNTLGIRSAATFGDYVFFAGPAFTPTTSINVFLFNAETQSYWERRHPRRLWLSDRPSKLRAIPSKPLD